MAKKTLSVVLPVSSPTDYSILLKKISEKNTKLGDNSPLKNSSKIDMAVFETKRINADNKRSESESFRALSEEKMLEAKLIYGTAKGQSIETPNTLYNMIGIIRDSLLLEYKGNEEALSDWGFKVVIGQAKSPKKKAGSESISSGEIQ